MSDVSDWLDGVMLPLSDFESYGCDDLTAVYGELVLNVVMTMAGEDDIDIESKRETGSNSFHINGDLFTWSIDESEEEPSILIEADED